MVHVPESQTAETRQAAGDELEAIKHRRAVAVDKIKTWKCAMVGALVGIMISCVIVGIMDDSGYRAVAIGLIMVCGVGPILYFGMFLAKNECNKLDQTAKRLEAH